MFRTILCALFTVAALSTIAQAEVRFGNNVRIGGHDVSNQTFDKNNRGLYVIHEGKPDNEGCRIVKYKDGSQTKVCNLQRKQTTNK